MVCNRCIKVVSEELTKLGLQISFIELGRVELKAQVNTLKLEQVNKVLNENGFELIDDKKSRIIEKIKMRQLPYTGCR